MVHERITNNLDFCKRIFSIQEDCDEDEKCEIRPILTYRFDDVDIKNRISKVINTEPSLEGSESAFR